MRCGELRQRVTILIPTEDDNVFSGPYPTESTTTLGERWAAVTPLSTRELIAAQQASSEATHKVTMRYWSAVTNTMRLLFDGETYEICSPPMINANKTEMSFNVKVIS